MRAALAPFTVREDPEHAFALVEYDGSADVYLAGDSMMANHISGTDTWQLLVEGARAYGWAIMPVGCSTCITDESQRSDLPDELQEDVAIVANGTDLLKVIRST